ncbi:MAG: TolC family protein [Candidatus Aminicenantes bacterium]
MTKHKIGVFILSFFYLAAASSGQSEKSIPLTLEDCLLKAMENNLGIAVDVLDPELAAISVSSAKEKFMPQLTFDLDRTSNNQPSYSWIDAADQVISRNTSYSAQISQLVPFGGSLSIFLSGYASDTNRKFQTINPRYGSTLRFNFIQPLLKDFGFNISRREIIIAQNNLDISENQFKRSLLDTIYRVEEAYWNLVYSMENLKVRKQSLRLARDLLEKNKRSVEVGTMAPIEILSAEEQVATREAEILEAEVLVKNNQDILKTLINLGAEEKEIDLLQIVPKDKPSSQRREITLEQALVTAMENRPDLQELNIRIKNRQLNLDYAKNQLLPDLSLQASYWSPGISGTQNVYPPGIAFGDPIETIPGDASDAIKDVFGFKYNNWSVGLSLSLPLQNILSRASFAQAEVNLKQAMLQLKNQKQQAYLEIKSALRAVQTNYKRIQARRSARELAEKKLEAEEEKFKIGLSTNYYVLQYQRDLTNAQTAELKAMIDYNLSLAQLNQALGTTLQEKNISLSKIKQSDHLKLAEYTE